MNTARPPYAHATPRCAKCLDTGCIPGVLYDPPSQCNCQQYDGPPDISDYPIKCLTMAEMEAAMRASDEDTRQWFLAVERKRRWMSLREELLLFVALILAAALVVFLSSCKSVHVYPEVKPDPRPLHQQIDWDDQGRKFWQGMEID